MEVVSFELVFFLVLVFFFVKRYAKLATFILSLKKIIR